MSARVRSKPFLVSLLATIVVAIVAIVAIVASSAAVASASTRAVAESRVHANTHSSTTHVGPEHRVLADHIGRQQPARYEFVSATGVATKEEGLALAGRSRVGTGS